MFQRTIPGFEPSPESYAVALAALDALAGEFAALGITDPAAVDLATAVFTGLTSQQIANDPAVTAGSGSSTAPSPCCSPTSHRTCSTDPSPSTGGTT